VRYLSAVKISAKDEYACAAVLELALKYDTESPIRVQDIAQRQGIPMKFLFQIMQILKRVDIVRSKRGTEGGYVLARHPSQITVGDVIRNVSGPFVQLSCLDSGNFADHCNRESTCHFKPIWAEMDQAISSVLNGVTFEDLVHRARSNQRQVMYHI
jgi:Rrf2 family protein